MNAQKLSKLDSNLPINYEYFFYFLDSQYPDSLSLKVLDYGCGDGLIVREGLKRGYKIFGVDNFYKDKSKAATILSRVQIDGLPIRENNANGTIPWPDNFFDVIISNTVMEHVVDLNLVVAEMNRVLHGGGVMVHVFPTREYVLEGHIGLPIVHWFPAQSKLRWLFARFMRKLGFGFGLENNTLSEYEWVKEKLKWVDRYVFYRSWRDIRQSFSRFFSVKSFTRHQMAFHLANKQGGIYIILQQMLRFAPTAAVLERLYWFYRGRTLYCRSGKSEQN